MDNQDYLSALDEADTKVRAVDGQQAALGSVGQRLPRTRTFQITGTKASGLVALRKTSTDPATIFVGRVLPGGKLIEPLAAVGEKRWQPIARLNDVRGADVVPLTLGGEADRLNRERAVGWFCEALAANEDQIKRVRARGRAAKSVFKPCLDLYDAYVSANPSEPRTAHLTAHLLGARTETTGIIETRSRGRGGDEAAIAMSVVNSLRRSAGTNYQGLVALAIAEELRANRSAWYIQYPPPAEYIRSLALRFKPKPDLDDVEIDPDIDILVRNAAWDATSKRDEPVVLLSVKTSLADRAGAAARWKMYFDVATHRCPFDGKYEGCAWHEQGLRFAKPDLAVRLQHCIVTANIYKYESDPKFAEEGELETAQTKANTFMFDRRYATRTGAKVRMTGWEPLTELDSLLRELSDEQSLPY